MVDSRTGFVGRIKGMRNAYRVLVGKPEEKRSLLGPRCARKDNIKMEFRTLSRFILLK
jgi:hypothetical protein